MMDFHDRWSRLGAEDRLDPNGLIHHLSEGGGEMKKLFGFDAKGGSAVSNIQLMEAKNGVLMPVRCQD